MLTEFYKQEKDPFHKAGLQDLLLDIITTCQRFVGILVFTQQSYPGNSVNLFCEMGLCCTEMEKIIQKCMLERVFGN